MLARDYFESAMAAQRFIRGRQAIIAAMREREGIRSRGCAPVGTVPSDPMRAVDDRIDAEERARLELTGYEEEVDDARSVCRGVRFANPSHPLWGDVLEIHFLELASWEDVAKHLGVSTSYARHAAYAALEWIDSVGIAAARKGMGRAEG